MKAVEKSVLVPSTLELSVARTWADVGLRGKLIELPCLSGESAHHRAINGGPKVAPSRIPHISVLGS
jgi:hypothetical protein